MLAAFEALVALPLVTFLACFPASLTAQPPAKVRVWQGTLTLPSYDEGAPDVNPPFDLLQPAGRPNYPYTIRDVLTDRRRPRAWRALFLENEYLKCSVLPDLGGHLYSCTDKVNGQEMFYANGAIKVSNIAYRGSWAAFGIEFNFPVSHNWMTTSPVDFALRAEPDGSASIWVGNVDRPYGMQWTAQLTLRPGTALLEQFTTLYNRSDYRRRFYWWTNAGVRAFDDTRILYPMKYTASHGFTDVDRWPVDARGTDNSVLRNHIYGPVSRFAHASREGFMGIWHPRTNAGVAHFAGPDELPAKKIWSWGVDADAIDWRRQLSDDSSAYVEIQAGLFRDQETYGFLQPQDQVSFHEYWMPLRELGGLTRMNPNAALHLERVAVSPDSVELRLALQVSRRYRNTTIRFGAGSAVISRALALTPDSVVHLTGTFAASMPPATLTVVADGAGTILEHTEGVFDYLPDSLVHPGRQARVTWPAADQRLEGDWLTLGEDREVNGDMLGALGAYRAGLALNPRNRELLRASARLAVTLGLDREGDSLATRALDVQPADHEIAYYRGLARLAMRDTARARIDLEQARQFGPLRSAALLGLLRCGASGREATVSLLQRFIEATAGERSERVREARALAIRRLGAASNRAPDSNLQSVVDGAAAAAPASNMARWLRRSSEGGDSALALHLAGDAERILGIADALFDMRADSEAVTLLATRWPDGSDVVREGGMPHPNRHALVAYYLAFARSRARLDASAALDAAGALPVTYVFPNRSRDREVLEWALRVRPQDQSARNLLAMMAMQRGEVERAIALWSAVWAARPAGVSGLYRNVGYALLLADDTARAAEAFAAGTIAEPGNPAVWVGNDSLLALTRRSVTERAAQLDRFPDKVNMPTALVYRYARLLASAHRFDDAEALFADRFFSRVEGGTNPRSVWLDVRAMRSEWLAAEGKCAEARRIVEGLGRPIARREFTRDGMLEQLERPALVRRIQAIGARCAR